MKTQIRGIGGWLKFLIFQYRFLAPLFCFGAMAVNDSRYPPEIKNYINLILLLNICVNIWLGNRLRTEFNWTTIRIVFHSLWLMPLFFALLDTITIFSFTQNPAIIFLIIPPALMILIVNLFWMSYLLRSKRIRNTYFGTSSASTSSPVRFQYANLFLKLIFVAFAIWYWAYWVYAVNWWNNSDGEQFYLTIGFFISIFVVWILCKSGYRYLINGTKFNRIFGLIFVFSIFITTFVGHFSMQDSGLLFANSFLLLLSAISGLLAFTNLFPSLLKWVRGNTSD